MEKFGRRLSVEAKQMDVNRAIRIAKNHIHGFDRVMISFKRPKVRYWYDSDHKCYIIAYTTEIEWKTWYRIYLHIGRGIVSNFMKFKRWFRWQRN